MMNHIEDMQKFGNGKHGPHDEGRFGECFSKWRSPSAYASL